MSKISQLTAASSLTGAESIPIVQSGNSRKVPVSNILTDNLFTPSGTGAVARSVQDYLRGLEVNIEDFGANTVPGTTDCSAFLQLAINKVALAGGGTVNCLNPPYLIATASGNTATLPADSATMPYCVELKANVKIKGPGRDRVTFTGDWVMRTTAANTSQKIMFRLTDSPSGASYYFEDCGFSKSMLPIYHSGIISGYMKDCAFTNCGLPFICQRSERFIWDGVDFGGSGAGIMVGGWLTGVAGAGGVNGGYADKCIFNRINYIRFDAGWTQSEKDLDTFFNTHFFANGTNGLLNTVTNYRGVVGISAFVVGRYDRQSFNTEFDSFFSYGSPRPMIYGGPEADWCVKNMNFERVGYTDSTIGTLMSSATDTWMSNANYPFSANLTRLRAGIDVYQGSGLSSFEEIFATNLGATDLVSTIQGYRRNSNAIASANPDLTNVPVAATYGEQVKVSMPNPDIRGVWINATTGTNAAAMEFSNTAGNLFAGIDNSTGARIGGVANAGCFWLDYAGTLLFGLNNTEAARLVAATGWAVKTLRSQDAQGAVLTAANNLVLGSDGNYFQVNGATQINLIANTNWQGGAEVTLKFNSTPTVKHNQANSGANTKIILNGAVDLVAAANNTLTLRYDSTDVAWYEQSRKV